MSSSPRSDHEQMADEQYERLKAVGDYKHGSIMRIRLKNFLTYSAVEFAPKPRLNMVVGPNGTGKSSILCAICLGLGGEPRLLGRATELETFIQNGEDEAEIELEVANEDEGEDDVVICRTIRKDPKNKSSFTWNGQSVSGKKVRERAASKFQIQIDNLCTFLPQEKVGNFSGFDSKALLLETEKTLGENNKLYNTHMELIKMQEELHGGDNQVESLQEKLEHLKVENKRLEREVQRMEERKMAEEQADLLRKKILWLRIDAMRERLKEMQQNRNEAKEQKDKFYSELQPLVDAHNEAKERLEEADMQYKQFDKEILSHKKEMEKQNIKYEKHDDEIEETLQELHAIDNNRAQLEEKVQEHRHRVQQLQNQVDATPPMEDLREMMEQARNDQKELHPRFQEIKNRCLELQRELVSVEEEVTTAKRKLDKLNDEKAQRRRMVFQKAPELRTAFEWIQNNRNLFRKEVIGPIACEVAPQSISSAAYLEQHVPNSTLKSFVVQNKNDYDLLYQKVRVDQKVPINIIQVDRIPPPKPRQYSEEKMAMLKRDHGVIGYLDESITAPEVVIEELKSAASIEKVLVGNDETQNSMDNRRLTDILSEPVNQGGNLRGYCIFTSDGGRSHKYTSIISKYSNQSALRVDDIKPPKWLTRGASEEAKQRVMVELEDKQNLLEELAPSYELAKNQQEELRIQSQDVQQRFKEARANINTAEKMVTKLQNAQRKLRDLEKQLSANDEEEKKHKVDVLNQRVRLSLKALRLQSEAYRSMMAATVNASGARLNKDAATAEERNAKDRAVEKKAAFDDAQRGWEGIRRQFQAEKEKFKELHMHASTEAPLQDKDGSDTPLKLKMEEELAQFDSVESAEAALEEAEQLVNTIVADPKVIRLYDERKREMEEVQDDLNTLTERKEKRLSQLQRKADQWVSALESIINKVDSRFSKYMKELGCVGEVALRKGNPDFNYGDEEASFRDYGVEIRVSFREGVKPSVLSARVQSGGERSVSTIMYLMALQDMMVAPFRCVDEINQGLDDRNERLVFKRIVENSTKPPGPAGPTDHCGQYWLITPKLLPNLTDMEVEAMNVVCIFNGPYTLKDPLDWITERLLAIRKRRREENGVNDDQPEMPSRRRARNEAPKKSKRTSPST